MWRPAAAAAAGAAAPSLTAAAAVAATRLGLAAATVQPLTVSAPAAGAAAAGAWRAGVVSQLAGICTSSMQQQGDLNFPPGQAFLDSLVDYEKQGVPKAAGVAAAAAAAPAAADAAAVPAAGSSSSSRGFDLSTMRRLLAAMGDPQQQLPVVHIAGTKGKGSVAALLSGVLRAAGYRVGTYTSPHMFDIRERIVVGGVGAPDLTPAASAGAGAAGSNSAGLQPTPAAAAAGGGVPSAVPISAEQFEELAVQAAAAVSSMQSGSGQSPAAASADPSNTSSSTSSSSGGGEGTPRPSHFEVVTAMALQHFVQQGVDIAVIETGLGGATDATNVFGPQQLQAAVLTAVGMDHVEALGGSLESIAGAKAGIMKGGVPVVVGPQEVAAAGEDGSSSSGSSGDAGVLWRVFGEAATALGCPLLKAAELVQVQPASLAPAGSSSSSSSSSDVTVLQGPGEHLARQLQSVSTDAASVATIAAAATAAAAATSQAGANAATGASGDSSSPSSIRELLLPSVQLQLVGQHQAGNVQTAVAAALLLAARGWAGVTQEAMLRGLEAAWLPGRFQVARLGESPTVYVLDGAHTGDSAAALAATLRQAFPELPVVLLVAMAADKQHREVLQALRAIRPRVAVFTSVPIAGSHARSAPPGTLAAHWQAAAMLSTAKPFRCREMIQAGLGAALDKARHELGAYGGKGVVVVTGSLHAVAAGLKHLQLA